MEQANKRLKTLLSRALGGASAEELGNDDDGVVRLSLTGRFGSVRLDAIWAGAGWPADVQRILDGLRPSRLQESGLVLTAQQMSPGATRLLEERGVNWADETGKARIVTPGVLVIREEATQGEPTRSLSWSPSAVAVAEALLARDWREGVRTTDLANLVQWSPGRVSHVLQLFDEEGWTVKYGPQRGSGAVRELTDSAGLLDAWAAAIAGQNRNPRLAHRTMRSPLEFLKGGLAEALDQEVRWALSGWGAAHLLAPMAGVVPSLQIYVHEEDFEHSRGEEEQPLDRALRNAGLTDVAEGGQVELLPAHPSVLALGHPQTVGNVVSSARIYADLLAMGGRGEDAATHLREELLEPRANHRRRSAPDRLVVWERDCRERLDRLAQTRPELAATYAQGTWSASYRLVGVTAPPSARTLLGILREIKGRESGWPAWLIPDSDAGPRSVDGMIESWFADTTFGDAAHADYWLADPAGRLCLIRGYQEDSAFEKMAPNPREFLDLTLPILRTGECLLHAARLAHRLDAGSVQFMMRWTGLRGRRLAAIVNRDRFLPPTRPTTQDEIVGFVESPPDEIDGNLAGAVRTLVEPLYESFDFFEPPTEIYEQELARMQGNAF